MLEIWLDLIRHYVGWRFGWVGHLVRFYIWLGLSLGLAGVSW